MQKKWKNKVWVGFPGEFLQEIEGVTPQFSPYTAGGDVSGQIFETICETIGATCNQRRRAPHGVGTDPSSFSFAKAFSF